jgi:PmbA protein
MRPLSDLKRFARDAAAILAREKDLAAFEVYCATAEHRVARLNYTSDIPSRGLEEFKSLNAEGFALRIVTARDPHENGFASCAGDFSRDAVREALTHARHAAVVDPHFPGLPAAPRRLALPRGSSNGAGDLMRARDAALAAAAWDIVGGAARTFAAGAKTAPAHAGLVVGGDISLIRDRIAIANSSFADIRVDESAHFVASVTALIEALDAKGTATVVGVSGDAMRRAAARLGRDAVARALALRDGERPPAGSYRVLLGAQPIAEIVNYMLLGSLTAGSFHAANSAYHGRFGATVMDERLTLFDDPQFKDGPVRRRLTCEGLPAAATELIRDGRLVGLLSSFYDTHRLLTDEHRAEKLGPAADIDALDIPPRSAYRLGESPARRFDSHPGASGTNVVMRTRGGVREQEMIAAIRDGIYVGRVWYTYPINGQRAGDFTCTVSGDSYVIRDGKLAAPLAPNCFRVNANISQVFEHALALGKRSEAAVVWGSPEAFFVPAIAVEGITLSSAAAPASD